MFAATKTTTWIDDVFSYSEVSLSHFNIEEQPGSDEFFNFNFLPE